jgi:hypothetical protein
MIYFKYITCNFLNPEKYYLKKDFFPYKILNKIHLINRILI